MSRTAVSSVIIYEGGEVFRINADPYETTILDTIAVNEMTSILWTLYVKKVNSYCGYQIFAVNKNSSIDYTIHSITGDELNIEFEVYIDDVVILSVINNEANILNVRGKRMML